MATANGRARSYSAPVVALLNANQQVQGNGVGGRATGVRYGSPGCPQSSSPVLAIRSMHHKGLLHNASSTPVVAHNDTSTITTRRASRLIDNRIRTVSISSRRDSLEMKCCRINVLLVTMQFCLGVTVTGLGLYMQTLTPSLSLKDCPYWAGAPVSI